MMDAAEKKNKPHPKMNASFFSDVFFWWMKDLFLKGRQKQLDHSDLYDTLPSCHSEMLGDKLEKNWNLELERSERKRARPSLLRAVLRTFGWSLALSNIILIFSYGVLRMMVPFFVGLLIDTFDTEGEASKERILYAAGIICFNFFWIIPTQHGTFMSKVTGLKIHAACSSLIYRKALRLGANTSAGPLVNLLSNDVGRFEQVAAFICSLGILPLQIAVGVPLMWQQVGISSLGGVCSMLLVVIPAQFFIGSYMLKLCIKMGIRTDERVRLMTEIISGIRVIKMYAWEIPFEKMVTWARRKEMAAINWSYHLHGYTVWSLMLTNYLPLFVTVTCYFVLGNHITAAQVFSTELCLNILNTTVSYLLPTAVQKLAATRISIKRLENFLLREEEIITHDISAGRKLLHVDIGVKIHKACAKWCTEDSISRVLHNVSLDVAPGRMCAVVGSVGSGKSSLFQAILGDLPLSSGTIAVGGDISYASQEPWLFLGTVRQNILFGQPYEPSRYLEVVRVCALQRDFTIFPNGDMTTVGERGMSLSGGQRARINLARAVYREATVYLLDSTLTAVDVHVGKHIFQECFVSFLRGKIRLVISHQEYVLKEADMIAVMNDGRLEHGGTYEDLCCDGLKYPALSQVAVENGAKVLRNSKVDEMSHILFKMQETEDHDAVYDECPEPEPDEHAELVPRRQPGMSLFWRYLRAGGSMVTISCMLLLFVLTQAVGNTITFWLRDWCLQEHLREMHSLTASTSVSNVSLTTNNRVTEEMDVTLVSGANHTAALPAHHLHDEDLSTGTSLIVYVSLLLVFSTLVMVRTLLYVHVCTKASTSLHDFMFHSVLRAVVEFFDDNPSGRVLNRFSKDLGAVDEIFPQKLLHTLQVLLVLFGSLITIAIVSYVCVVPMFLLGILIYCICIVYIRTGQSIKRLEATTCSPVFSHVSMTLSGVTTIRASRAQEMVSKQFHSHQDVNTSAIHLSLAAEYAFALWIDMSVSFYVAVIIISFFIFGESDAGNVALAVVQALSLMGRLQFTTCMMSEVTTHMTSVQRVLQYADISTEENLQSETGHKPQDSWPSKGAIQFDHVSVKYSSMDPPVLDDISLNIEPGQKVGIVGRTGAGKSSLISGLFRLAQLEGCIRIDQVDIRSMGLHDLRSHISIIPQEPVLFTTSLRNNLDPLHSHSDAELWSVLHEVELGTSVKTLDAVIATEGSHFSSGQRQLICLARAILRNNKILIMDEATANVDPQTDALIQATIRRKFKDCTVLTIAHRLSTILDSDRVLVLDAGSMVEFGDPHTLLQNHEGYFYKMVQEESESENSRLPRQYSTVDDI